MDKLTPHIIELMIYRQAPRWLSPLIRPLEGFRRRNGPMNLVSTVMQFLTPMITNRIASALGVNNTMAATAIGAIVPAILAAMVGKSATPSGAGALAAALGQQDPGLLGSFANMLGGSQQNAMISSGSSALSSLLGGSATSALAGAVGKFAGLEGAQSSNLIGMLGPVVMGTLAQTQKSSNLDAGGLATLLAGQKDNIAAAMPSGFAQLLGGSGLLDSIAGNMKPAAATPAAPKVEMPKVEMPKMPSMPPMPTSEGFNWMPWAAGAAGLLALFWAFSGSKPTPPVAVPATQATVPAVAGPAKEAMEKATKVITGLRDTLGGIKDGPTAQAAVPKLTEASTALDALGKLTSSLPAEGKSTVASLMAAALPQLTPLIAGVLKVPGAEALLKPALDGIVAKVTAMSKT
jgi:Bacterial protein of unknown function (DUF937)